MEPIFVWWIGERPQEEAVMAHVRQHLAQAFQRQVAEFNELSVALAKETVKPVQDGFTCNFGEFTKSFAA